MIVGTRGSKLALVQTDYIRSCLYNITGEEVEKNIIKTKGDKITNSQLYNMDSKGLFTRELDNALLDEEVFVGLLFLFPHPTIEAPKPNNTKSVNKLFFFICFLLYKY